MSMQPWDWRRDKDEKRRGRDDRDRGPDNDDKRRKCRR